MPIRPENRSLYPKDWPAISKRIRFERAGGRCEFNEDGTLPSSNLGVVGASRLRCTAIHGHAHPITGSKVILTTAHLDHDPTNCADKNLLAGCQFHHNQYDQEHRKETRRRTAQMKRELFVSDSQEKAECPNSPTLCPST